VFKKIDQGSVLKSVAGKSGRIGMLVQHQSGKASNDHQGPDQVGEHTQPGAPGEDGRLQRIVTWRYSRAEPRAKHSRYDEGYQTLQQGAAPPKLPTLPNEN